MNKQHGIILMFLFVFIPIVCAASIKGVIVKKAIDAAQQAWKTMDPLNQADKYIKAISEGNVAHFKSWLKEKGLDFTKDALVISAEAIRQVAAAEPKVPLTVNAVPDTAKVRVMNIGPKYKPGMELPPGRYDIEVTNEGYRSRREYFYLSPNDNEATIKLNKVMPFKCDVQFERGRNSGPMFYNQLKSSFTLQDITINEAFFALATGIDKAKYMLVTDSGISGRYAYYEFITSPNVSYDDIRDNKSVLPPSTGYAYNTFSLEQLGNGSVKIELYNEAPKGKYAPANDAQRETICSFFSLLGEPEL